MRRTAALVVAVLLLGGCGSTEPKSHAATGPHPKLQFRKVALPRPPGSSVRSSVPASWAARFTGFTCPRAQVSTPDPDEYTLLCDTKGTKYLLEPASLVEAARDVTAEVPRGQGTWAVDFRIGGRGRDTFTALSRELVADGGQLAVALDGRIIAEAAFSGVITNGRMQITGGFTEQAARDLADRLAGR